MKLNLKNPLIFFDLETTGIDILHDRIVEICYIKIMPNGDEVSKLMRVNPEMHIPEKTTEIHGITDDDVKDCKTFKQIAADLVKDFEGCDIAGFNSNRFDIPMLVEELDRAGIDSSNIVKHKFIDVQNIYHKLERRTLSAAYKFYCGKDLEDAHSALGDTLATYEVLKAQLDMYPDQLQNNIDYLAEYSTMNKNVDLAGRIIFNENDVEVFNFGKYRGKSVVDVLRKDQGYYSWILQGDFAVNTKQVLTKIRLREMNK